MIGEIAPVPPPVLSLELAMVIAQGALAAARARGCKPMSVVVLDAGGHAKLVLREDGTGHFGVTIATAKAAGVLGFNAASSRVLADVFGPQPALAAALADATGGRFLPLAGGVRITAAQGAVLGAVGASGDLPDRDEAVVLAGLGAAGLPT